MGASREPCSACEGGGASLPYATTNEGQTDAQRRRDADGQKRVNNIEEAERKIKIDRY